MAKTLFISGFLPSYEATSAGQRVSRVWLEELMRSSDKVVVLAFVNSKDRLDTKAVESFEKSLLSSTEAYLVFIKPYHRILGLILMPFLPSFVSSRLVAGRRKLMDLFKRNDFMHILSDFSQGLAVVPVDRWCDVHFRQHDIVSNLYQRRAVSDSPMSLFYRWEYKKTLAWERKAWRICRKITTLTEEDQNFVKKETQRGDIEYQYPAATLDLSRVDRKRVPKCEPSILFFGNLSRFENEEAILWFLNNCLPAIQRKVPDIRVDIVGAHPSVKLQKMANDRIRIHGYLDDITDIFSTAWLAIAPLAFGSGIKLKVVETLEAKIPTVATLVAAEGIKFDGTLLEISNREEFARKVISLLLELKEGP